MASIEAAMYGRDLRQLFDGRGVVGLTEAQLVDRIAHRDESAELAFEAILRRHGPAVLACCRRVLGDTSAAEDAFQATFAPRPLRCLERRARTHKGLAENHECEIHMFLTIRPTSMHANSLRTSPE
jgi:hypothetical protein